MCGSMSLTRRTHLWSQLDPEVELPAPGAPRSFSVASRKGEPPPDFPRYLTDTCYLLGPHTGFLKRFILK